MYQSHAIQIIHYALILVSTTENVVDNSVQLWYLKGSNCSNSPKTTAFSLFSLAIKLKTNRVAIVLRQKRNNNKKKYAFLLGQRDRRNWNDICGLRCKWKSPSAPTSVKYEYDIRWHHSRYSVSQNYLVVGLISQYLFPHTVYKGSDNNVKHPSSDLWMEVIVIIITCVIFKWFKVHFKSWNYKTLEFSQNSINLKGLKAAVSHLYLQYTKHIALLSIYL